MAGPDDPVWERGPEGLPILHRAAVTAAEADYNGHMNVAYFPLHYEEATRRLFEALHLSRAYREATDHALFALEQHIVYRRELPIGSSFAIVTQILDLGPKLLRVIHLLQRDDGVVASSSELLFIHVSLQQRRSVPFPDEVLARLRPWRAAHAGLPWPEDAGRAIGGRR